MGRQGQSGELAGLDYRTIREQAVKVFPAALLAESQIEEIEHIAGRIRGAVVPIIFPSGADNIEMRFRQVESLAAGK